MQQSIPRKILVSSGNEGNYGKTTLIKHFVVPALKPYFEEGVRYVAVEDEGRKSVGEDLRFKANDPAGVLAELRMTGDDEAIVVEIGAQQFDRFTMELARIDAQHFSFDRCIFPISPALKSEETLKSVLRLIDVGVRPEDIYVVWNRVELMAIESGDFGRDLEKVHKVFVSELEALGVHVCKTPVFISDLFETLRELSSNHTIPSLANLKDDYFISQAKAARKAGDTRKFETMMEFERMKLAAGGIHNRLKGVFEFAFPELVALGQDAAEQKAA